MTFEKTVWVLIWIYVTIYESDMNTDLVGVVYICFLQKSLGQNSTAVTSLCLQHVKVGCGLLWDAMK